MSSHFFEADLFNALSICIHKPIHYLTLAKIIDGFNVISKRAFARLFRQKSSKNSRKCLIAGNFREAAMKETEEKLTVSTTMNFNENRKMLKNKISHKEY